MTYGFKKKMKIKRGIGDLILKNKWGFFDFERWVTVKNLDVSGLLRVGDSSFSLINASVESKSELVLLNI